jgi:hypothetical protein
MAISINWLTRVITIPISFMTLISGGGGAGSLYELDVDAFRLALKDIEDDDAGMTNDDTHRHNPEVTLAGVTYARTFEIINNYTVTFEELGGGAHYTVRCVGANHNIADALNFNSVNLIIGNAAGLIVKEINTGSGLSVDQANQLIDIWQRLGLDTNFPLVTTTTAISAGGVQQTIDETAGPTVTVTRTP